MGDEYITLARVLKTQGRHGEVAVEVHSDVPDRFVEGMRLFALDESGQRRQLKVEDKQLSRELSKWRRCALLYSD